MEEPIISDELRGEIEEQMNEAIKLTMANMGLEVNDPEAIEKVKASLRKSIEEIVSTAAFHAGSDEKAKNVLKMKYLKTALAERGIKVDRPDYILEQQQTSQKSMSTRRSKSSK